MNSMPAASSARLTSISVDDRLGGMPSICSNLLIVATPTFAFPASMVTDHLRPTRAQRIWAPVIIDVSFNELYSITNDTNNVSATPSLSYSEAMKIIDWRIAFIKLEGAYSDGTLRAYKSDFTTFEAWCLKQGLNPLPASPETVALYLTSISPRLALSTLKRRLAAIKKIHRLAKFDSPVADEEVVIALRRAKRSKTLIQRQALGLTQELRDQLIRACPNTTTGLRDRALIAVGYDTLSRRSELVAFQVSDFHLTPRRGGEAIIRRSKNDPFGAGRRAYLSSISASYLQAWLSAAKITTGYIFVKIDRHGCLCKRPLNDATVSRIIKKRATDAKLSSDKIKRLSGHSLRVGAAQDMMKSDIELLPIMRAGGWRSVDAVSRYVENVDIRSLFKPSAITK